MAVYTTKLGDKICEATATSSIGLRHICKQLGVAYSTVTGWVYNGEHELCAKYGQAKIRQLHHLAEEILEIADDSTNDYMTIVKNGKPRQVQNREAISRSRLRIQTRMNLISKLAPILRNTRTGMPANLPLKVVFTKKPYPPGALGDKADLRPSVFHSHPIILAEQKAAEEEAKQKESIAAAKAKKQAGPPRKTPPNPRPQHHRLPQQH